jgi:hypothetical protein
MPNYLVAQAEGGIMEKPDWDYIQQEWIHALSEAEAKEIYKKKYNPSYWQVVVIEKKY